ncbi:MAG TPA: DUF59 domain-containing protein [Desulfobacteraceae bacterium]|nr:DUF59 domain-containing protein [Desulfobacteraceae bacterium]
MSSTVSEKDIRQAIAPVKHPAIDNTLVDLGMVKDVEVKGEKVTLTLAFPFPNIPIEGLLINSLQQPLKKLGVEAEIKTTVMSPEELQKFLAMEQAGWKGGH